MKSCFYETHSPIHSKARLLTTLVCQRRSEPNWFGQTLRDSNSPGWMNIKSKSEPAFTEKYLLRHWLPFSGLRRRRGKELRLWDQSTQEEGNWGSLLQPGLTPVETELTFTLRLKNREMKLFKHIKVRIYLSKLI